MSSVEEVALARARLDALVAGAGALSADLAAAIDDLEAAQDAARRRPGNGQAVAGQAAGREVAIIEMVAQVAGCLTEDFDVIDTLTTLCERLVDVIGIDACGVLLADGERVEVAAVSGGDVAEVEFVAMQVGDGPCLKALRRDEQIVIEDASDLVGWPAFAAACQRHGFTGVAALPLPGPDGPMGSLNVFRRDDAAFAPHDLAACGAIANVVVLALMNARAVGETRTQVDRLQHALQSRIVIEQAKGVVARDRGIDVTTAFDLLRSTARRRRVKLHDLAADIVGGWQQPSDLV